MRPHLNLAPSCLTKFFRQHIICVKIPNYQRQILRFAFAASDHKLLNKICLSKFYIEPILYRVGSGYISVICKVIKHSFITLGKFDFIKFSVSFS